MFKGELQTVSQKFDIYFVEIVRDSSREIPLERKKNRRGNQQAVSIVYSVWKSFSAICVSMIARKYKSHF